MRDWQVRAVLALALSGLHAGASEAQRRELSFLAGGTFSKASGSLLTNVAGHAGVLAGMTVRLPRGQRLAMEVDFLIVHRRLTGERAPSTAPPAFAGPEADFAKLTFVEIPLMFRFQEPYRTYRPVRPFLFLGPSVAIRLACGREVRRSATAIRRAECAEVPQDSEPFAPALYQDVDVALHAGAGVEIRRLSVFVRANRSLRNLVEGGALPSSPFDGAKLWGISAGVDYVVRVF
jgi:hypothetical protein